ncbi:MAG: hypothetical protein GQ546_07675, partial [Gammaproteobacteria bacterium]|nr:hypothetical protein [Gammaproteobacteria bacterium]
MKFKYSVILLLSLFCFTNNVFSVDRLNLVSEKQLQEKIKTAEVAKNLDEKTKSRLIENYTKTLDYLELINTSDKKYDFYTSARINAPKQIKLLEKKLNELEKKPILEKKQSDEEILNSIKKIPLSELEQKAESTSIILASITVKNSDLNLSLTKESQNLPEIRKKLITANTTLEKRIEDKQLIP